MLPIRRMFRPTIVAQDVVLAAVITIVIAAVVYSIDPSSHSWLSSFGAFYRNNELFAELLWWSATLVSVTTLLLAKRAIAPAYRWASGMTTRNDILRWLGGWRLAVSSLIVTSAVLGIRALLPNALPLHEWVGGPSWAGWVSNNTALFMGLGALVVWGMIAYLGGLLRHSLEEASVVRKPKTMGVTPED